MKYRALRGGSCFYNSRGMRASYRNWSNADLRYRRFGFRVVVKRRKP